MHKISKEKHQSSSSNQYIKDFSAPCTVSFQMPPLALIATYFADTLLVRASGANRNMRLRSLVAFYCILSDTKKELQLWLRLNCRKRRNVLGFSFPHLSAILLFFAASLVFVWFHCRLQLQGERCHFAVSGKKRWEGGR